MQQLAARVLYCFAKWSKPKPRTDRVKEYKKSFAIGDEKAAKLSKSEQELENKLKLLEKEKIERETMYSPPLSQTASGIHEDA